MPHSQNRREFLKTSLATIAAGGMVSCSAKTNRPNILFIFSDQQHWHALGCMDSFFDTPFQDVFAEDSVVFDQGFCTTPQCSPSRSSILTGLYPHKTGVYGNIGAAGGNDLQQTSIAKTLHDHGYKTAYVGKWHLGDAEVAQQGIDKFLKKDKSRGESSDPLTTKDGLKLLRDPEFTDGPFALFLSYVNPHDIYAFRNHIIQANAKIQLPPSWANKDFSSVPPIHKQFMTDDQGRAIWGQPEELWFQYRDCYRSKVKLYDAHFGQIIQELQTQGLWNNTIVVNTSDHGDMDTHNHLIWKGPFIYEHMVRVPVMIRVPEAFGGKNGRRLKHVSAVNVDFVPTLLDICGIPASEHDGQSLKLALTGGRDEPNRDFIISEYYSKQKWVNPIRMIRTPEFKYNRYILHGEELYDLKNDPGEVKNLASDAGYQSVKNELAAELDKWIKKNNDPFYSLHSTDREGKRLG